MHHHNAPALSSQLAQNVLAKHQIPQVPQPPYSLGIAQCDFYLFPKVKMLLKGNRFQDRGNKTKHSMQKLAIAKRHFQKYFGQWKDHWNKCVMSEGACFEGD